MVSFVSLLIGKIYSADNQINQRSVQATFKEATNTLPLAGNNSVPAILPLTG